MQNVNQAMGNKKYQMIHVIKCLRFNWTTQCVNRSNEVSASLFILLINPCIWEIWLQWIGELRESDWNSITEITF